MIYVSPTKQPIFSLQPMKQFAAARFATRVVFL